MGCDRQGCPGPCFRTRNERLASFRGALSSLIGVGTILAAPAFTRGTGQPGPTLGPRGFRVTSPNLAERGGVQVGAVIVAVNGQPVNGFADVYRVYSQIQRDPSLSMIQLHLERQGRQITKTYRIR